MSPPICHRTLTPGGGPRTFGGHCLGSACSLWVPEAKALNGTAANGIPAVSLDGEGDPWSRVGDARWTLAPTSRGWCADNLRREPWPDPAAPKAGGAP